MNSNKPYTKSIYWQDALQDAELLYIEKSLNLEQSDKEKWIFATAFYYLKNYLKKSHHCVCLADYDDETYITFYDNLFTDSNCQCDELIFKILLEEVLEDLSFEEQQIINLRLEGFKYYEIAERLDLSSKIL